MTNNTSLCFAKVQKQDEYYTKLEDIAVEMERHLSNRPSLFAGKTVYCPCDHPLHSNFVRYLLTNFHKLGLARLIATSYTAGGKGRLFDFCGQVPISFVEPFFLQKYLHELDGNGDFRSMEVRPFWQAADICITNPPFSLAHEFLNQVLSLQKDCFVIAPQYTAIYKNVFPYVRCAHLWMDIPEKNLSFSDLHGNLKKFGNICWLTTFDDQHRAPLTLRSASWNLQENQPFRKRLLSSYGEIRYERYNNYDGIDVPRLDAIPSDYEGIMGVPIGILGIYDPRQFEIIGFGQQHEIGILPLGKLFLDKFFAQGKKGHYTPNMRVLSIVTGRGGYFIPFQRVLIRTIRN